MDVEIISNSYLKPSFPTPPNLRYLKLSLLDQLTPAPYAPIVFFYNQVTHDPTHTLRLLRDSLSHILMQFYPLAGSIQDELTIDCNDDGFRYLEAQVNCRMDDYLTQPDLLMIHKFLPVDVQQASGTTHVGNVQINIFKCGGVAIGLCVSHKILDGVGLGVFMNAWAAAARGEFNAIVSPNFNSVSVFPTASSWLKEASLAVWGAMVKPGKFVTKRFLFDSASIVKLKDQIASTSKRHPTRIQAVSALLWKSFIKVSRQQEEEDCHGVLKPSVMTHLVNLRRRVLKDTLPITDQTLCNLLWIASATVPAADTEPELSDLSEKVSASIAQVDNELVHKLRSDEAKPVVFESFKRITEPGSNRGSNMLAFTSWCKFGLYEADFGWGKPIWISSIGVKAPEFLNLSVLVDTRDGDGIEAWVSMEESDINVLHQDPEVRRFAVVDPSPLEFERHKLQ